MAGAGVVANGARAMYCELHCHSHYSLLDGASSPEALVDRAAELGMPALALTDHDGLYGAVAFWRAARARGIRAVIGAEIALAHGSHLTLLAECQAGYANLSRLISVGQLAGTKGASRLTIEDVAAHAEGLFCLSGCRQGAVAAAILAGDEALARRAAGKLAGIFGRNRLWIECQRHWLPRDAELLAGLVQVAQWLGVGVVATNDVHYAAASNHRLHDVLVATRHNVSIGELGTRARPNPRAHTLAPSGAQGHLGLKGNSEFYLKGEDEMSRLFPDHPQALAASHDIAARCEVSLDFSARRFPAFRADAGQGEAVPIATGAPAIVPQVRAGAGTGKYTVCTGKYTRSVESCNGADLPAPDGGFQAGIPAGQQESTLDSSRIPRTGEALDCKEGAVSGIAGQNRITAFSLLHSLCQQGLQAKYRPVTPQAVRQLAHELAVIQAAGLVDYFLIVWDIVRFARQAGIRCQGRGSAANSLVAYLLGITPVDPLRYDLLFERFLSDRTDTMPDIDIDFAADRRDEVIAYVYERYGADHTAMVCNVVTYRARSAVRDVARALGYSPADVDRLSKWVRRQEGAQAGGQESLHAAEAEEEGVSSALPGGLELVTELAGQLEDTPRHLSVHVGGMLVTAQPLVEVVPLEHATKPGVVVAQWNKDSVEDAGLIKIDLLSLCTLGMLTEACALIAGRHGIDPDLDALPLDDPAVYRLLGEGDTIGCFQVESRAQAQMLPRLQPKCFEDLVIEVSIVRPGPIQGGMVHPYLRRRQGLEPVTYLHPSLEPALRETLGVIIFQEQVIRVAVALAGFTPGEADMLRRAMSRNRSASAMAELGERFVAGALANGVAREVAEEAFRQLQGFATYGFCKSHAASFALVAYQTLWLKAHYPAEFYCALLNHQPMGFYAPDVVVNDARRHGLTVLRPDVNQSEDGCTLEREGGNAGERAGERAEPARPHRASAGRLRLGLRYLHGLGEAGRARLLAARGPQPFADLADLCRRTRLPKPLIADLIRAGAMESLAGKYTVYRGARRQLLWLLGDLHYQEEVLVEAPATPAELPELDEREALSWDYELLGLAPDNHPLRLVRARLHARGVMSAAELSKLAPGRVVQVAGLVVVRQAPPTAKGHLFISLEDETGLINLVIRPDLYASQRRVLHDAGSLLAEGILQKEGRAVSVLVKRVAALAEVLEDTADKLRDRPQPVGV